MVAAGTLEGVCPAHGLTTLYFLIRRHGTKPDAEVAIDHVLRHFRIGNLDGRGWEMARNLAFDDFEDAAVAAVAESSGSQLIITRNKDDFDGSPVLPISPAEFLSKFPAEV